MTPPLTDRDPALVRVERADAEAPRAEPALRDASAAHPVRLLIRTVRASSDAKSSSADAPHDGARTWREALGLARRPPAPDALHLQVQTLDGRTLHDHDHDHIDTHTDTDTDGVEPIALRLPVGTYHVIARVRGHLRRYTLTLRPEGVTELVIKT